MDRRIVTLRYRVKEDNFSQKSRLDKVLFDGAICGLIREAEVVVATRQQSLMYQSPSGGNGAAHNDDYSGWHPRRQDCLRAAHQRIRVVALRPCQKY